MSKFGWDYPPGAANDPFAPYNQDADYGDDFENIIDALKAHDSGHWQWDKIDCCLTGRDADLEPWGQQGIEVVSVDDEGVMVRAHTLKTWVGDEVCLNLDSETENDDDAYYAAREAYLDQANEVVCGCGVRGEWDGDSWIMSDTVDFFVPWVMSDDTPDYQATAQNIVDAACESLRGIEEELVLTDEILNVLSGWSCPDSTDARGYVRCESGKPSRYAAWLTNEETN